MLAKCTVLNSDRSVPVPCIRVRWRGRAHSDAAKQFSQTSPQSSGNLLDIQQRHVPDASLDTTVVRAMQPASLSSLFLIDLLLLADAPDCTAKTDADVEGHDAPMLASHSRCVNSR